MKSDTIFKWVFDKQGELTMEVVSKSLQSACDEYGDEMKKWESCPGNLSRIKVLGGWLYRMDYTDAMAFVPDRTQMTAYRNEKE